MIFKVYYQVNASQVPVRENTKTIYVEAESERDVRLKIKHEPYNIEFIQPVTGDHLEYEKRNADFKVLEQ
ncbi:DUF1447 family protein [Peribacillus saganii]|uniref:DNA-directed RNA polymerase subunit epsilon n=1 Tax=Peribacillus saganii TaxID=2303992 RepID=A0A372LSB7_9BACI|nr:DNA-directed RNA polymerase subunit epsilon [Peribacillus saganii]RFU71101.1 DUF1447 family protein [Peribacillus saganii]